MTFREVEGAPKTPNETTSGPLHSHSGEGRGMKRNEVRRFQDILRARGLSPESLLVMSKRERAKIISELREVAEQSRVTPEDAETLFRNRADINSTLADAFKEAGLAGESAQDIARRLQNEIPETKVN